MNGVTGGVTVKHEINYNILLMNETVRILLEHGVSGRVYGVQNAVLCFRILYLIQRLYVNHI